jgi:hypothetical protein
VLPAVLPVSGDAGVALIVAVKVVSLVVGALLGKGTIVTGRRRSVAVAGLLVHVSRVKGKRLI